MTIYFIIFVLTVIFIIGISKWNIRKKVLLFIIFLIISLLTFTIVLSSLWNSSGYKEKVIQEQEYIDTHLKKIKLINTTNQTIDVSVNFTYSPEEIQKKKLNIIDYYNKNSSIRLESKSEFIVTLPVPIDENLEFPYTFSVISKDSLQKTINYYDKNDFFINAQSNPLIDNEKEKYKAEEWILHLK